MSICNLQTQFVLSLTKVEGFINNEQNNFASSFWEREALECMLLYAGIASTVRILAKKLFDGGILYNIYQDTGLLVTCESTRLEIILFRGGTTIISNAITNDFYTK